MDESKCGICRLCLAKSKTMYMSIYEKYKDACISDYIKAIADVKICVNDGLPDRICSSCLVELEQAVQFKQKCESSHHILTSTPVIKTEDEIDIIDIAIKEEEPDCYDQYDDCENNEDLKVNDKSEIKKSRAIDLHLQCDDCKEFFKSKCKLQVHWKKVHLYQTLKCPYCKITFKSSKAFNSHIKKRPQSCKYASKFKIEGEGKKRVFHCKRCTYNSQLITNLLSHQVVHTKERPYKCDICLKTFKLQTTLQRHHYAVHSEQRVDIPCHVCGKLMKDRTKIYRHMRVHSEGEWPCPVCLKRFKCKYNLNNHMNRHKGEKSHTCEICAHSFFSGSELTNHKRYVHEKRYNIYKCDFCDYTSKKMKIILKHKAKHSNNNVPCTVCGMFFESKEKLVLHQKKHFQEKLLECMYCDKKFCRKSNVRNHIKNIHKREVPEQYDLASKKKSKCNVEDSKTKITKKYIS